MKTQPQKCVINVLHKCTYFLITVRVFNAFCNYDKNLYPLKN